MTASLIAIAHIAGSMAAVVVLGSFLNRIESWSHAINREQIFEEASTRLGISANELETGELKPELLQFFAERFSGESPGNRISDALGAVRTFWVLLGFLLQAVVLAAVAWYACSNSLKGAVHAWWIVAISLVFGIANFILARVCKLLTGRFPGQAGQARKGVAQLRESLEVAAQARARRDENARAAPQPQHDDRQSEDSRSDIGNGQLGPRGNA